VVLELGFAYGAGLAPTSALVIRVNGAPWNMLRLDRSGGDIVDRARVELPMGLFRPGPNVIGFEPVLHPADRRPCAALGEQAMFSLFDDSRIRMPAFARLARQPDLALFAATGFPYGDAHGIELLLGERTSQTLAAAWTLRGKLAQQRRAPLPEVVTVNRPSNPGRHLLVVGASRNLPDGILDGSPFPLRPLSAAGARAEGKSAGTSGTVGPAPGRSEDARAHWSQRLQVGGGRESDGLFATMAGWLVRMARAVPVAAKPERPAFEELAALGGDQPAGTMVAFVSPVAANRTLTLVTAPGPAALADAVALLIQPRVWSRLEGDVTVWDGQSVLSHRVAEPYLVAPVDRSLHHLWLLWRTYMAENPGQWLILVAVLIASLSTVTGVLLRRRAEQ
jgi:cellulose synthase operon protein B